MKKLEKLDLKKKKYIIFDMDGTLIDSVGVWNTIDQTLIVSSGGPKLNLEKIQQERHRFLEVNSSKDIYLEYCDDLIKRYHLNSNKEDLLKLRYEIGDHYFLEEMDYLPQADEVLKTLKRLGYTLVLATITTEKPLNIYRYRNQKMTDKVNMSEIFDLIIKKEDIFYKKPHPEIYLKVLKHYDARPEDCLVFEDSLHGVQAAKRAGIEVVNVYDACSDLERSEIDQLTDYKINNYQEILDLLDKK